MLKGYAEPVAGLTPPVAVPRLMRSPVPAADPANARVFWQAAGEPSSIRVAAPEELESAAEHVAEQWREALGVAVEVTIHRTKGEKLAAQRALAEKRDLDWDVHLQAVIAQASDTVPVEMHRAFVAGDGEYRAGPPEPEFEAMYAKLVAEPDPAAQLELGGQMEKLVLRDALAIGLYAPHALYAVNREVEFVPYRTSFELADTSVTKRHWSRR